MGWTLRKGVIASVGLLVLAGAVVAVLLFMPSARIPAGAIVVPRDVPTLEQALAQAEPGATILLDAKRLDTIGSARVETEGVTVRSWNGRVRLHGEGSEPALSVLADGVMVRDLDLSAESIGVFVAASGGRLDGIVVLEAPVGVQLSGASGYTLEDVEIGGGQIGLELASSNGNVIRDVTINSATEIGVKAAGSRGNSLERVAVAQTPIGFSLAEASTDNLLADCRAVQCDAVGVEISGSNDNRLSRVFVSDAHTGVALEHVTGCSIEGCRIERASIAGIRLEQSDQNRLSQNVISSPAEAGILLQQSSENTVAYNGVEDGFGAGVQIDAGEKNLVTENDLSSVTGISVSGATACRILRNSISARTVGILLEGGADHHLFDNRIQESGFGVGLVGVSGAIVLRTDILGASEAGLALLGEVVDAEIVENRVSSGNVGVLVDGAARSEVRDNGIEKNGVGLFLVRCGSALRIEGNTIRANTVGLRQADPSTPPALRYDWLGVDPSTVSGANGSPILANNSFSRNVRWDVENDSESALHAGGNWWGRGEPGRDPVEALVSGNVLLEASAWKGTIAIAAQDDDLSVLLGRILQVALVDSGYRVIDLIGMQDEDLVWNAVLARDADLMWWDAGTAYDGLKAFEDQADIETFDLPARRGWLAVVPSDVAASLQATTLDDLTAALDVSGGGLRWAVPSAFGQDALDALEGAYGLGAHVTAVDWTRNLDETEALLKFGVADLAIVDSLEETVTLSGFVSLVDGRGAMPSQRIAALVRREVVEEPSDAESVLAQLQSTLTAEALHDLISRVRLLHRDPEAVAREFLEREGVLSE
jgi:parallel beta-helix repeat protein